MQARILVAHIKDHTFYVVSIILIHNIQQSISLPYIVKEENKILLIDDQS